MSVTAYLQGGMSNQMWIYGAGLALAKRFNTALRLNISSFTNDPMREYSLHLWDGVTEETDKNPPTGYIVHEEGLPYNQKVVDRFTSDCTIWGYWQCPRYLEGVENELRWRFIPKQFLTDRGKETLRQIQAADNRSVFLTIRRTDYLQSDYHGVLPLDYYLAALDVITGKVPTPEIFVFSDDPEWCRENIRFPYKTVIAGNFDRTVKGHIGREDEELTLMRSCHHAICANSSYSWWGSWLGADHTGGIVVCPKHWFLNAHEDSSEICPPRWIAL